MATCRYCFTRRGSLRRNGWTKPNQLTSDDHIFEGAVLLIYSLLMATSSLPANTQAESLFSDSPILRERDWFDRQTPETQKDAKSRIERARVCVARYQKMDGAKAAMIQSRKSHVQFLFGVSNGTVLRRKAPGMDGCSLNSADFVEMPDAHMSSDQFYAEQTCASAAFRYAAQFNARLAKLRLDLFQKACPGGLLKPAE